VTLAPTTTSFKIYTIFSSLVFCFHPGLTCISGQNTKSLLAPFLGKRSAEQDLDGKLKKAQDLSDVMHLENDNVNNTENPIAVELGEPQRNGYQDIQEFARTMGSTSDKIDWEATLNEWLGIK